MQSSSEYYSELLDSLLIFDRILPAGAPDLPPSPMSRRVFDVGLDMGRIRNSLHRRGHLKRNRSQSASEVVHSKQDRAIVPRIPEMRSVSPFEDMDDKNENVARGEINHDGRPPSPTPGAGVLEDLPSPSPMGQKEAHPKMEFEEDPHDYDLKPPPSRRQGQSLDGLSERLFSADHLRIIIGDPALFMRFTAFLNRYKSECGPILVQYLEAQKALKAVEYANALADAMKPLYGTKKNQQPCNVASVNSDFEQRSQKALETLVSEALPAYITLCFVKIVTETLVREITGTTLPMMRDLVGNLAEVFCLADPSQPDTPIIYASEEFNRTTQYGRDYVVGRNCRFLQGPRTNKATVRRLAYNIRGGMETSETLLNYRRDGSPFMNLLMTAPLFDNKGKIRYILGAQIDVSGLVEEGRGLESFERLLKEKNQRNRESDATSESRSLRALDEFGRMLSLEESSLFQGRQPRDFEEEGASSMRSSLRRNMRRDDNSRTRRRILGNEDDDYEDRNLMHLPAKVGVSGRLPGVYQYYMLVRPAPSLRIVFVSPALRIPGLLQTPFLSRVEAPPHVRSGIEQSLRNGDPVAAKITWLADADDDKNSMINGIGDSKPNTQRQGANKTRFISCTPLLGTDDQIGVWIVVMVEDEKASGGPGSAHRSTQRGQLEKYDLSSTPDDFSNPGTQDNITSTPDTNPPTTDATSQPSNGNPMSGSKQVNGSVNNSSRPSTSYTTQQSQPQHRRYQSMDGDSNSMYHDSVRDEYRPNWSTMGKPWSLKEQERHRQMKRETLSRQDTEEIPRRREEVGTI